jgi:hypothetical protein
VWIISATERDWYGLNHAGTSEITHSSHYNFIWGDSAQKWPQTMACRTL